MKIPTQIWIFCVGIFLQHYTFLQKRTFCILCEKFFHFVRKATASVMADTEKIIRKKYDVPIWHKSNLTIDEAVEYSGIGRERLRKLTSQEECPFVLHIGNRRMIKRRIFDEYIEKLTFLE